MGNSCLEQPFSPGWDSNFRAYIKGEKKENGRPSQGKSRKMRGSNKTARERSGSENKWEGGEGGREGGVKKRKGTPLSLYYPSVTGLLGSCYGYGDSRLSVLLTIAHKGSIQLWATMQISLSLFLFLSFCLHRSLNIHIFPFSSQTLHWIYYVRLVFYPSSHPPLFYTRPSHIPPSP